MEELFANLSWDWGMILYGVISGAVLAGSGWLKSKSPEGKIVKFEVKYAVTPLVIGGIAGGAAGLLGLTFDQVYDKIEGWAGLVGPGGVGFLSNLMKIGSRRGLKNILGSALQDLK